NYITTNSIPGFNATDFASLTTGDLALIPDNLGGEITKDGKNAVVRWYQGGLNYYYYEIRHYDTTSLMAFGKYGVVRNNWYSLTLGSVSGSGTPWYPDINNPGPGDPDPTDPIDEGEGFLGIKVEVAPWIIWSRIIGI
ncbi:MAG: fimbria major subunit, partial [Bacteroides sp.]|nr:fimbria major subunit [Bacteroides sp.]